MTTENKSPSAELNEFPLSPLPGDLGGECRVNTNSGQTPARDSPLGAKIAELIAERGALLEQIGDAKAEAIHQRDRAEAGLKGWNQAAERFVQDRLAYDREIRELKAERDQWKRHFDVKEDLCIGLIEERDEPAKMNSDGCDLLAAEIKKSDLLRRQVARLSGALALIQAMTYATSVDNGNGVSEWKHQDIARKALADAEKIEKENGG